MNSLILSGTDNVTEEKKTDSAAGQKQQVTVRLFGSIRAAAGREGEELELPSDCVVYEFLRLLSDIYGSKFKDEIFQQVGDGLRDDLTVSINGVITEHKKLESIELFDGAVIALLPTFPGGG